MEDPNEVDRTLEEEGGRLLDDLRWADPDPDTSRTGCLRKGTLPVCSNISRSKNSLRAATAAASGASDSRLYPFAK